MERRDADAIWPTLFAGTALPAVVHSVNEAERESPAVV